MLPSERVGSRPAARQVRHFPGLVRLSVSIPNRVIRLESRKGGEPRTIPLSDDAVAILKETAASRGKIPGPDERVFLSGKGQSYGKFPGAAWNNALDRAGLTGRGLTPHSMRRSFAAYYDGTDRDCQEIMGHSDLATTLIYRSSRPERMREAMKRMDLTSAPADPSTGTEG